MREGDGKWKEWKPRGVWWNGGDMTAESFMMAVEQKWVFWSLSCILCQLTCLYATYRLHRGEEERRATAVEGGEKMVEERRGEVGSEVEVEEEMTWKNAREVWKRGKNKKGGEDKSGIRRKSDIQHTILYITILLICFAGLRGNIIAAWIYWHNRLSSFQIVTSSRRFVTLCPASPCCLAETREMRLEIWNWVWLCQTLLK